MTDFSAYISNISTELGEIIPRIDRAEFEMVVLELLHRTGKSFGEARDRHTNLE